MTIRSLVFVLACGCSGVHSNPISPDAHPDAEEIDAPPDAPTVLVAHHYIIDSEKIPTTQNEARALGLDLNGDTVVDNQLGMVMDTFAIQGFDVQTPTTTAIDRGLALVLVDFEANSFTTSEARFTLFSGANPSPAPCSSGSDTICRHHLDGTGSFAVSATSAHDTPLGGNLSGGVVVTKVNPAGHLQIQTSLLTASPITLNLVGARVLVSGASDSGITNGVIGGAVVQSEIDGTLIPAWQQSFNAAMLHDCPGAPPNCGCVVGSKGATVHQVFDTAPRDCTITVSEIQNSALIHALLAPDLTIEGQMALSVGFGFTAKKADFTP
jgi:hypothetical protein